MKNKWIICLVMTTLMMAMTHSAFATASKDYNTVVTAECRLPEITVEVTVPATGKVYVNPFGQPIAVSGSVEDGQIISEPAYIENKTEVPVLVSVTATGTIKKDSNMYLTSTSTKDIVSTAKKAFVYFEIKAADGPDQVSWDKEYDAEKHLLVRTTPKTRKNIVKLGAAEESGCYGVFRLTGDCVANPKIAWTVTDGFDVEIAFTFTPTAHPGI